ncbi:MAG: PAS domain-containing protein [Deltaproteobacteria bacterium]|nr:PAS domain-containing protein [Deltaproteobacteria bacterium]
MTSAESTPLNPSPLNQEGYGGTGQFIVGIGASAGGLDALQAFFDGMPCDTSLAFVVVQHLSPHFKSLMDQLLQRHTQMQVLIVEDGMKVSPNTIYLNSPRRDVSLSDGHFVVHESKDRSIDHPINVFFESLAKEAGARGVGVILSGTGTDGARGMTAIHAAGGLTAVQAPSTAEFTGMPQAALDTRCIDFVSGPSELPTAILQYLENPASKNVFAGHIERDLGLDEILRLLQLQYSIDFTSYKLTTVGRRITRRLDFLGMTDVREYAQRLANDPAELDRLYQDLLIGVTKFFRDPEAFAVLAHNLLPALDHRRVDPELRIWVPGCATGEEVYSLLILLHEFGGETDLFSRVKVFATDVHDRSLRTASEGIYPETALEHLDPERKERYFRPAAEGRQVTTELRRKVVFARHNILHDTPFTKLDLISCRNLLIYFGTTAQRHVLTSFHYGLRHNGFLWLGPSESLGGLESEFETIDSPWKLFRKTRDVVLPYPRRAPGPHGGFQPILPPHRRSRENQTESWLLLAYDALLERFAPAGFLIDRNRQLLHIFGDSGAYLKLRGRTTTDVLEMLSPELRTALGAALYRAEQSGQAASYAAVPYVIDGKKMSVDVRVLPLAHPSSKTSFFLITLEGLRPAPDLSEPTPETPAPGELSFDRIEALEHELKLTRERLQAALEEADTGNEELQATNEELVASNEELQSTNEELQSVNEELYTVNAEYQQKIQELTSLTADMNNLLNSTRIGTVFLDRELRIRKFTSIENMPFRLLPQDVGRPFDHVSSLLIKPDLIPTLERVMMSEDTEEYEVQAKDGTWYLLRLLPYRGTEGDVDGVVLTALDIDRQHWAERRGDGFQEVLDEYGFGRMVVDLEGDQDGQVPHLQIADFNAEASTLLGRDLGPFLNRPLFEVAPGVANSLLVERCREAIRTSEPVHYQLRYEDAGGRSCQTPVALHRIGVNRVLFIISSAAARKDEVQPSSCILCGQPCAVPCTDSSPNDACDDPSCPRKQDHPIELGARARN